LSSIVPSDEEFTVPIKVRDAIRLVEHDGWVLVRQKGSHRQYYHPTKPGTVTIAGKESLDLDPKTERSIRRQAGLP
jgi:predicted RNA binding protein YcfA (HicA-like mRNA interferase family)